MMAQLAELSLPYSPIGTRRLGGVTHPAITTQLVTGQDQLRWDPAVPYSAVSQTFTWMRSSCGSLVKRMILIQRVCGGAQESAFPVSSQAVAAAQPVTAAMKLKDACSLEENL